MDQETLGNVVLLALVTLISVVQNGKGRPSPAGSTGQVRFARPCRSALRRSLLYLPVSSDLNGRRCVCCCVDVGWFPCPGLSFT